MPSEMELRTHRQQLELLVEDVKRVSAPDLHAPFASLQDAIDRLLPHHILAEEPGEEADMEETEDRSGQDLLLSRHAAWLEHIFRKTIQYVGEAQLIHDRVLLLRSAAEQPARSAIEDDYLLAQWAHDAEKEAVIQLRAEQAARETTEKATRDRAAADARIREAQQAAQRIALAARAQAAIPSTHLNVPTVAHHASALPQSPALVSMPHSVQAALQGAVVSAAGHQTAAGQVGASSGSQMVPTPKAEDPGGWSGWSGWTEAK